MPTYRLDLAYDGGGFHGFARQPGIRTVQGELEEALARLTGEALAITCAGRTDAGVHARHQVVSFETVGELDCDRLVRGINGMFQREVAAIACRRAPDGWSARFAARWRAYRYTVLDRHYPDPLRRHLVWHVAEPLDLAGMNRAASHFTGEHDFASFCRAQPGKSTVRQVLEAGWTREGADALFTVRATSFCHQMVRSLVGFCVEVGRGRRHPDDALEVLAARDRAATFAPVAPPHGLVLWAVGYEDGEQP
jgi:tRNA pseudouridine38-40 synthase